MVITLTTWLTESKTELLDPEMVFTAERLICYMFRVTLVTTPLMPYHDTPPTGSNGAHNIQASRPRQHP